MSIKKYYDDLIWVCQAIIVGMILGISTWARIVINGVMGDIISSVVLAALIIYNFNLFDSLLCEYEDWGIGNIILGSIGNVIGIVCIGFGFWLGKFEAVNAIGVYDPGKV